MEEGNPFIIYDSNHLYSTFCVYDDCDYEEKKQCFFNHGTLPSSYCYRNCRKKGICPRTHATKEEANDQNDAAKKKIQNKRKRGEIKIKPYSNKNHRGDERKRNSQGCKHCGWRKRKPLKTHESKDNCNNIRGKILNEDRILKKLNALNISQTEISELYEFMEGDFENEEENIPDISKRPRYYNWDIRKYISSELIINQ